MPSVCPSTSSGSGNSQASSDDPPASPGRKKRSPKQEEESVTKADNEGNARFVKLMMSIAEDTRISLGHSFGPQFSVIENATRTGFIYQCVYKGLNCNNER